MELLSPAGAYEGVLAAVSNGADAVYLGLGDFNARRNAKNLSKGEFLQAVRYCRVRGVRVYVTLNTLLSDREMGNARELCGFIYDSGADGILVQDLGALDMVRSVAPQLDIHASTQMSVHSLEGCMAAHRLGVTRVVLARELTKAQIREICAKSPVETEVFVHGALCMCYSGQCYMSSVIGGRSGNRGLCAQPCRLGYGFGARADEYPLSLKDLTLAEHLAELEEMGVKCIKLEGRMKRPEYSAIVTRVFSNALKEKKNPSKEEMEALRAVFSRDGFTDGYYAGKVSPEMFGTREDKPSPEINKLFSSVRAEYLGNREPQRIGVEFFGTVEGGKPVSLSARDEDGNTVSISGDTPQASGSNPLISAKFNTQLYKTGGTPYYCTGAKSRVQPEVMLPLSAVNALRREALSKLTELRGTTPSRERGEPREYKKLPNRKEPPGIIIQASRIKQLTPSVLRHKIHGIYIPLAEICANRQRTAEVMKYKRVAAVLPRIINDTELPAVAEMLDNVKELGIGEAVVGNIGHIGLALDMGFKVRGDFGLNVFNTGAVEVLREMGLISVTLSFELSFAQIRDISKQTDCEAIIFGRLPLMVTENCIIKNKYGKCVCENNISITDRRSVSFPVVREFNHRNIIYNSQKLFLADKRKDWEGIGLGRARILLTTESSIEAESVVDSYLGNGTYQPNVVTRGLYYRGVE